MHALVVDWHLVCSTFVANSSLQVAVFADSFGHQSILVERLVKAGANIKKKDHNGNYPIHCVRIERTVQ
jgi:hypothetical protein